MTRIQRREFLKWWSAGVAEMFLPCMRAEAGNLSFTPITGGEFAFDTGILRGKLRASGRSLGLSSVVHIPTGKVIDRSNGLFGHYRVFSKGKRYGNGAWDWPSEARLLPDGSVVTIWPAAEDRPFVMVARYQWHSSSILDLETVIQPQNNLSGFESFLACYFNDSFNNAMFYLQKSAASRGKAGFQRAERVYGEWLMSPRDTEVVSLIRDGRWTLQPNPVDWVLMPQLAAPLAIRHDAVSGLAALIMAPATDCFAVSMPHETDGHFSVYLSLFGRDLKSGETARARSRLMIGPGITMQKALAIYKNYRKTGMP